MSDANRIARCLISIPRRAGRFASFIAFHRRFSGLRGANSGARLSQGRCLDSGFRLNHGAQYEAEYTPLVT